MADDAAPHVMIAALCEGVDLSRGLTINSVFTGFTQHAHAHGDPSRMMPFVQRATLAVVLTRHTPGQGVLAVRLEGPLGGLTDVDARQVAFEYPTRPEPTIFNLILTLESPGLHYFDVFWDDLLLTRVPLYLTFTPDQEAR